MLFQLLRARILERSCRVLCDGEVLGFSLVFMREPPFCLIEPSVLVRLERPVVLVRRVSDLLQSGSCREQSVRVRAFLSRVFLDEHVIALVGGRVRNGFEPVRCSVRFREMLSDREVRFE